MSKKTRRFIAFNAPLLVYAAFLTILLVTRFTVISSLFGLEGISSKYLPRVYNFVPFKTITGVLERSRHFGGWLEVIGNILLTVPLGIYIYVFGQKLKKIRLVLIALLSVCFIESAQFALATGSLDVDDIILNFIGTLIGLIAYHAILTICKKKDLEPRLVLSCISMPLIPVLVVTVIQELMWVPFFLALAVYTAGIAFADFLIYQLFKLENNQTKTIYIASCVILVVLFFAFVNPMITP